MGECIWRDENGRAIPLEECTKEQLVARFKSVVARHHDEKAAWIGKEEALFKRLQDHRKAKAEANKRADKACEALKLLVAKFGDKI